MSAFFTVNDVETTFAPCARVNASEAANETTGERERECERAGMRAFFAEADCRPHNLDNFALFPSNYLRVKTPGPFSLPPRSRTHFELIQPRGAALL